MRNYERFKIEWDPSLQGKPDAPIHQQRFHLNGEVKAVQGMFIYGDFDTVLQAEIGVALNGTEVLPKEWNAQLMAHNSLVPLREVIAATPYTSCKGESITVDIELRNYQHGPKGSEFFYLYVVEEV